MFIPDPGSDFFPSQIRLFSIPDPGSEQSQSRIPDPHQKILCFNPKKGFLSSRKYDPGCSSRIRMLTSTHPGSRGQKGTGSRIRIRNTDSKVYSGKLKWITSWFILPQIMYGGVSNPPMNIGFFCTQ
jgi:hypothetical protein